VKLCIVSLGCSKNTVDSENLIGLLEASGVEIVSDVGDADVALVNTCGFIQPAGEERVSAIQDLERLKQQGKLKKMASSAAL
jgi:ribosomal protein S12 methylthiotransferase